MDESCILPAHTILSKDEGWVMQEATKVQQCACCNCTGSEIHADQLRHHQINLLISRLNEQERRWFVALESKRIGHGGDTFMSQVTGLHVETIRRGRRELDSDLQERPVDRIRLPGGGRPSVKKKTLRLKKI